jgi:predicted metal-dependent hydrolase
MGVTSPCSEAADNAGVPPYTVRKSARARRVKLRVDLDGTVTVIVPSRARATGYEDFVRQHTDWILKQQARFAALRSEAGRGSLCTRNEVNYRGRTIPLTVYPIPGKRITLQYDGDRFVVYRPVHATDEDVQRLFRSWFRDVAKALFAERVVALNAATNYTWRTIRIGEQKTKWGSCSTRGTLSFNWRLLMAPPEILDYVVIHELSHLKEPNHSAAFWALVEARCPNHKAHRRWLNKNGVMLSF